MSKSLWKPALLGGVTLFVWSTISWTVLPWHNTTFNVFFDEDEVARVIGANTPGGGVYLYPGDHHKPGMTPEEEKAATEAVMTKMAAGPFLFVSVSSAGMSSMVPATVKGFIFQILAALVLAMIVVRCGEPGYWERVTIVVLVVIAAGILCYIPSWNWFGFATGYTLVMFADLLISGLLAGLVIAKLA